MWEYIRYWVSAALKIPPVPGMRDGRVETLRPDNAFFHYRLLIWAFGRLGFLASLSIASVVTCGALAHSGGSFGKIGAIITIFGFAAFFILHTLFSLVVLRLDYERRWYLLGERTLRVREGVYRTVESTLTFANVQSVTVTQGPIQRLFGISDVEVDSAGGGGGAPTAKGKIESTMTGHVAILRGLRDAESVRVRLSEKVESQRGAGLGEIPPEPAMAEADGDLSCLRNECAAFKTAAERLETVILGRYK